MKTLKKYLLGAALISVAALTGCEDKMIELNTDPSMVGETNPEFMFYTATRNLFWAGRDAPARRAETAGYMQYGASISGSMYTNAESAANGSAVSSPWKNGLYYDEYYSRAGRDLQHFMNYIDTYTDKTIYQEMYSIGKIVHTYLAWLNFDVYGAAVWTESFKANEGITSPKYDLYQDVYKDLDALVKEHTDLLNQARPAGTVDMGEYDPFYRILTVTTPGTGGCTFATVDAATARARWVKLGNTIRLKMAHRVNRVDNAHFESVLAEVTNPANGGMMEAKADGWHIRYPYTQGNSTDDGNQASLFFRASVSFINSLSVLDDPRLPLLVRPNTNTDQFADWSEVTSYANYRYFYDQKALRTYFPVKLAEYGHLTQADNYFIGLSSSGYASNPNFTRQAAADVQKRLLGGTGSYGVAGGGGLYITITNTNYTNGPGGMNGPMLAEDNVTEVLDYLGRKITAQTYDFYAAVVSPYMSRYFVKEPSQSYDVLDVPKAGNEKIRLQRALLPYEEHCFRMALISLQNKAGAAVAGKTATQWYEEGIRTAFAQLQENARWSYLGIATSSTYPVIKSPSGAEYNPGGGMYDVTAQTDAYVAAHPLGTGEAALENIGVQAWIAMFYLPEEAWAFWKQTGYPRTYDINPRQNAQPVLPAGPGMELVKTGTGISTVIARRATLPTPQAENLTNYNDIIARLIATGGYGSHQNQNQGRIWWDTQNPDFVMDPTPIGY